MKDTLSEIQILRHTLGIVQSLCCFIEASPKRHALYMNTKISSEVESSFVRILKSLSMTRWSAHHDSVKAVDEELFRIIKCLYELSNDTDAKTSAKAKCLLTSILDFEFLIGLAILKIILPNTSSLNSYVQSSTIDIRKVKSNADLTIKTIEGCRSDTDFDLVWDSVNLKCRQVKEFLEDENMDLDFKDPRLPRNLPENVTDMKEYQKVRQV